MKIIQAHYEIQTPISEGGIEELKLIEKVARTCYKSEDKITEDGESAKKMISALIKSDHCYDGETEVLTEEGWIKWKNYSGEKVATINEDLSFNDFEIPQNIIKHEYTGKFYKYPNLGIEVTDEHRMLGMFANNYKDRTAPFNPIIFTPGTTYVNYHKNIKNTLGERFFRTISCCQFDQSQLDPYYVLLGFWLGDGCHEKATTNVLNFHIRKQRKISFLQKLCEELNFKMQFNKNDKISVIKDGIGKEFNLKYYTNEKYLPTTKEHKFSLIEINSIIKGLLESDGSVMSSGIKFCTTSNSIAKWFGENAPLCGYNISSIKCKIYEKDNGRKPLYTYFILKTQYRLNNDSRKPKDKVIITDKKMMCYCVSVTTGLILVRGTNGVITICGNCAMLEHSFLSVRFWIDRAVATEVVRHRLFSFAQESTRYVNYSKDKYGNEINVIDINPCLANDPKMKNVDSDALGAVYVEWLKAMEDSEKHYMNMIELGASPQTARSVLPNSTKTELNVSGNYREWRHFFKLRCDKAAHPQIREVAIPLLKELQRKIPIIFDDIVVDEDFIFPEVNNEQE